MAEIKCQYCGATADSEDEYCKGCGGPLKARRRAIKAALRRQSVLAAKREEKLRRPAQPADSRKDVPWEEADWVSACLKALIVLFFVGMFLYMKLLFAGG